MQAPSERLPWLHDEPPAKAAPKAARKSGAGAMWPWYLLLLLLVGLVSAGAWWLSTGKEAPAPELPAEESLPIPVTESAPAPIEAIDEEAAPTGAEAPTSQQSEATVSASRSRTIARQVSSRSSAASADELRRGVFPADDFAVAPPQGKAPPVVVNPNPDRGRVVQLGAFPTRRQAEDSWKRITRRYPYIATKPRMINTVDVRALGGGRPTRMYRLQFGTSSQAQSVVICQRLERAGHSCVVVY